MARSFNLTANLVLAGPTNLRPVVNSIKTALSNITANVDVKINAQTQQNVNNLKRAFDNFNVTLKQTTIVAKDAATALRTLSAAVQGVNLKGLNQQMQAASKAAKSVQQNVIGARGELEEFGRVAGLAIRRFAGFALATGVIMGFIGAVKKGVVEALNFQDSMVKLSQLTGDSVAGSFNVLGRQITDLSKSLGVSSAKLTDIAHKLVQTGLKGRETAMVMEALAKTMLAPAFSNVDQTMEGTIAMMSQFKIPAQEVEKSLSSMHAVAAKFAVESQDLITAVRISGGAFATMSKGVVEGREALNQFMATFTSIRGATRESAESIATGLRTIFTRLERPEAIESLKQLGVELLDLEGKFVGPFEAINKISAAMKNMDPRDIRFAQIAETLGGYRQIGKVLPMLANMEMRMKALAVAQSGEAQLTEAAARAQESWNVQLTKTHERFLALIRDVSQTDAFKAMMTVILGLANSLIKLGETLKPLLPYIGIFFGMKAAGAMKPLMTGFFGGIKGKMASGGMVPGSGSGDTFPAMLTPGEFVVRKDAVRAIGANNLAQVNKMEGGGKLNVATLNPTNFQPERMAAKTRAEFEKYNFVAINQNIAEEIRKESSRSLESLISKLAKKIATDNNIPYSKKPITSGAIQSLQGYTLENVLDRVGSHTKGSFTGAGNKSGDFLGGLPEDTRRVFELPEGPTEVKRGKARFEKLRGAYQNVFGVSSIPTSEEIAIASDTLNKEKSLKASILEVSKTSMVSSLPDRIARYKASNIWQTLSQQSKDNFDRLSSPKSIDSLLRRKGFASGGSVDSVPAMLTPGEFVINKQAASKLGSTTLHRLNNADKFANGGPVQYFKTGGEPLKSGTVGSIRLQARDVALAQNIGGASNIPALTKMYEKSLTDAANVFKDMGMRTSELNKRIKYMAEELKGGADKTTAFANAMNVSAVDIGADATTAKAMLAAKRNQQGKGSIGNRIGATLGAIWGSSGTAAEFDAQGQMTRGAVKGRGLKGLAGKMGGMGMMGLMGATAVQQLMGPESAAGSAIGGAMSGASIGGMMGGPAGAVIGAAMGGIGGIMDAKTNKELREAQVALTKATKDVDTAFTKLAKGGSIDEVNKSLDTFNKAIGLKSTGEAGKNSRAAANLYGLLGGTESEKGVRAEKGLVGMGLEKVVKFGYGAADMVGKLSSSSIGQFILPGLGGLQNDQDLEQERATRAAQKAFRVNKGLEISQAYGAVGAASEEQIYKMTERGSSLADIEKMSPQMIQSVAMARNTDFEQTNSWADTMKTGDKNSPAYQQMLEEQSKAAREALKPQIELAEKMRHLNTTIYNATLTLEDFGREAGKIASNLEAFDLGTSGSAAMMEARYAGPGTLMSTSAAGSYNIFKNADRFSGRELSGTLGELGREYGIANPMLGQAQQYLQVGGNLQSEVSRIASQVLEKDPKAGFKDLELAVAGNKVFTSAPQEVKDMITGRMGQMATNKPGLTAASFLRDEKGLKQFEDLGKEVKDLGLKIAIPLMDAHKKLQEQYRAELQKQLQLQIQINEKLSGLAGLESENSLRLQKMINPSRTLSLEERFAPTQARLSAFGKVGGVSDFDTTNVSVLKNKMTGLRGQETNIRNQINNLSSNSVGNKDLINTLREQEAANQEQQSAIVKMLEILHTDNTKLAAIEEDMAKITRQKAMLGQGVEEIGAMGPEAIAQFNRQQNARQQFLTTGKFGSTRNMQDALAGSQWARSRMGSEQEVEEEALRMRQGIWGQFGPKGAMPDFLTPPGKSGPEQELILKFQKASKIQLDAGKAIVNLDAKTLELAIKGSKENVANQAAAIGGMARGGPVGGAFTGRDSIPAMLMPGEFVMRREAVAGNLPLLEAINNGVGFANGGLSTYEQGKENRRQAYYQAKIDRRITYFNSLNEQTKKAQIPYGNRLRGMYAGQMYHAGSNLDTVSRIIRSSQGDAADPEWIQGQMRRSGYSIGRGKAFLNWKRGVQGFADGGLVENVGNTGGFGGNIEQSLIVFANAVNRLSNLNIPSEIRISGNISTTVDLNGSATLAAALAQELLPTINNMINSKINKVVDPNTGETYPSSPGQPMGRGGIYG